MKQLEEQLQIKFKNKGLLREAFVHRSFLNENPDKRLRSNERLEFLGDAILEFLASGFLYQKFSSSPESRLSKLRARLVCDRCLAQIARQLNLGQYLLLGQGEKASGGQQKPSLLSDTFEALVGAIYLDQGLKAVDRFLGKHLFPTLRKAQKRPDFKSNFQSLAQAKFRLTPFYKTLKSAGPDHEKTFTVGVYLGKSLWGEGTGQSKQAAEEKAAQKALAKIKRAC